MIRPGLALLLWQCLLCLPVVGAQPADEKKLDDGFYLFKDGRPMASLVVPPEYQRMPGERLDWASGKTIPASVPGDLMRAVELFRGDLKKGYGIDLPLGEDPKLPNQIKLVVRNVPPMEQDTTHVTFPSANIMQIEGGQSGIIRTLFFLLEQYGGVRYLFQETQHDIGFGAHFPPRKSLQIPREAFTHRSAFPLDRRSPTTTYGANWEGDKNRSYYWNWEARLGTKVGLIAGISLSDMVFPLEKYSTSPDHPDERIFPVLNGKRVLPWEQKLRPASGWQPDYESPEAVDEAVKNILAHLRANPDTPSLSLSANMGGGFSETMKQSPSEAYYGWVNKVAEAVTKEFPNVFFGVTAFREVVEPPPFKLHPNVVAYLTFDYQGTRDPEVRAMRVRQVEEWAKVARIGTYCHNQGTQSYTLPRIYTEETQDMLQLFDRNGAVATFTERPYNTVSEGPRMYVYYKLLEDPYLNLEETVQDWCNAAVGAEAAPYLRSYYAFWEDFWKNRAVKTPWWDDRDKIYLSAASYGPYMFALKEGDMTHCREIMQKVVDLAAKSGTPDQQARARLLMWDFEYYEACAAACGAGLFANDGTLPDAQTALRLLDRLPQANAQQRRAMKIVEDHWIAPNVTLDRQKTSDPAVAALTAVADYADDPEVRKKLEALSQNQDAPENLRILSALLLQNRVADTPGNMDRDGGFEKDGNSGWDVSHPSHGTVKRTQEQAASGAHALRCEIQHENFRIQKSLSGAEPGKDYYFSARILLPKNHDGEARVQLYGQGAYKIGKQTVRAGRTRNIPDVLLPPGKWVQVNAIIPGTNEPVDSLLLGILLPGLPAGSVVYVDDIFVAALPSTIAAEDGSEQTE